LLLSQKNVDLPAVLPKEFCMVFDVKDRLTDAEVEKGLKAVTYDGMATQAIVTFSSGVFLVAYAIQLGASNFYIGVLAAIPMLAQLIQVPSVYLVEKVKNRRLISFYATLLSRVFLMGIALAPILFSGKAALMAVVVSLVLNTTIGAVSLCAWNSWMRDLVPENRLGSFFSRRMSLSLGLSIVLSLAAAFYIDYWTELYAGKVALAYTILFSLAYLAGIIDNYFIAQIPEPRMHPSTEGTSLLKLIKKPLKDKNFRHLLKFLGAWNFAVNLAAPFFAVYLLKRLGMDMSYVIGLTVLSQVTNVLSLRIWGGISDRFSNKTVLGICGPLFMFSVLAWTFTTMPEIHSYTMPLLIVIHIFLGISLSGVTLATSNIALKLAPRGEATAYLATSSLIMYLSAGVAPIVGGEFIDFFSKRELAWILSWTSPEGETIFQPLNLQSWDFFFFFAFILGLYSIHRLALVREEGEVHEKELLQEVLGRMVRPLRNFSTAGGLKYVMHHPLSLFKIRNGKTRKGSNS